MKFDLGHINKVYAITAELKEEQTSYSFQEVKLKKGEIVFGKSGHGFTDMAALIKKTGKQTPYVMHFEGKGILNRSVERTEDYRHSLLLNVNLNQFYFSDYLEDTQVYSSIIRKDAVDPIIDEFKKGGVEVVAFSSGPFLVSPLNVFIEKNTVDSNDVRVRFNEKGDIESFEKNEEYKSAINLGGDLITAHQIGAVASAINFFKNFPSLIMPDSDQVFQFNYNEAKQKNIFFRFGAGMVFFFFAAILANYLYLGSLNNKIEMNYAELAEFEDQLGRLSFLEEEVERKQNLLNSSGLLNRKFLSFYLMEISNSVPSNVKLTNLTVRPLEKELKKRHKIEFLNQTIWITGEAKSSDLLSSWIDDLKEYEWLNKVDILDYSYVKNVGEFELELQIL